MKKNLATFLAGLIMLAAHSVLQAQTIAITSVPATHFCYSDPVSVAFSATGKFGPANVFKLQLSDSAGTFSNTSPIIDSLTGSGSATASISGSIPDSLLSSTQYRFRIFSTIPPDTSAPNTQNISITYIPPANFIIGTPLEVMDADSATQECTCTYMAAITADSVYCDFGPNAIPPHTTNSDTVNLTYSKGGVKTIVTKVFSHDGCARIDTSYITVFDCNVANGVVIPHDAIVIDTFTADIGASHETLWIDSGITVNEIDGSYDTIFAEKNSQIIGGYNCIAYVKSGAYYQAQNRCAYLYGVNATVNSGLVFVAQYCPNLSFNYSQAPPNQYQLGVATNDPLPPVRVSPNPARSRITIDGIPIYARSVALFDILGKAVRAIPAPRSTSLDLDLSDLLSGTYYLRIATANGVSTTKIVRE